MATNRIDTLDPALIRPGRIDRHFSPTVNLGCWNNNSVSCRKIEFPMPDEKTKRRIFNIHTGFLSLYFTIYRSIKCEAHNTKCDYQHWIEKMKLQLPGRMTLAEDVDLEEYIMCKVCHSIIHNASIFPLFCWYMFWWYINSHSRMSFLVPTSKQSVQRLACLRSGKEGWRFVLALWSRLSSVPKSPG